MGKKGVERQREYSDRRGKGKALYNKKISDGHIMGSIESSEENSFDDKYPKDNGFSIITFFGLFFIYFFLFSLVFLGILSLFPEQVRVRSLFESLGFSLESGIDWKSRWGIFIAFMALLAVASVIMWFISQRKKVKRSGILRI